MDATIPSCDSCGGACCRMDCEIVFNEREAVPRGLTVPEARLAGARMMKKKPDKSCVALINGRCSIYERRPYPCRDVTAGDEYCLTSRELDAQGRTDINAILTWEALG